MHLLVSATQNLYYAHLHLFQGLINLIIVQSINSTGATISWITDETANSTVYYGLTEVTTLKSNNATFLLLHSIKLVNLVSSSLYYFNVSSCDSSGNCNYSKQSNFTTLNGSSNDQGSGGSSNGGASGGGGGGGSVSNPTTQSETLTENNQNPTTNVQSQQSPEGQEVVSTTQGATGNNKEEKKESSIFSFLLGNTIKTFKDLNFMGLGSLKSGFYFVKDNVVVSSVFFAVIGIAGLIFVMHRKNSFENFKQKDKHKEIVEDYHGDNNEKL